MAATSGYFEIFSDLISAENRRKELEIATNSRFVSSKCKRNNTPSASGAEDRLPFGSQNYDTATTIVFEDHYKVKLGRLQYTGVPFACLGTNSYNCQFGSDAHAKRKADREKKEKESTKDNIKHAIWEEISQLSNHTSLGAAARRIPDIVMASKSKNTNQKYTGYFNKFDSWCSKHGFISLPAKVTTVCLFLSDLTISEVSDSVLEGYFYAINWKHELSLLDNPCANKLTKLTFDGSRRMLCQPKRKKQPVTVDILNRIVDLYNNDGNMNFKDNRLCTMCILGFSGFLRFNELSSLQMKDVKIHENYLSLFIKKSKTDQLQKGSEIVIAKTGNKLCPVSWLKNYLTAAGLTVSSNEYIFTKVKFLKSKNVYVPVDTLAPLSYSRTREIFLEAIVAIGENKQSFGLHSLRSGGASASANSAYDLDSRLLNKHGRWKSSNSSDGYIHYSLNKRLQVSQHLGI